MLAVCLILILITCLRQYYTSGIHDYLVFDDDFFFVMPELEDVEEVVLTVLHTSRN